LADRFRANQIQPISLAVFIKIFFRCSLTEKRSLADFHGANNVHCAWMALTGRFPNSDHPWLVLTDR
jgi:hypothetical protein